MTHDDDRGFARDGLKLMKCGQNKDCGLSETRLGLAKNVDIEECLGNADLLDCSDRVC